MTISRFRSLASAAAAVALAVGVTVGAGGTGGQDAAQATAAATTPTRYLALGDSLAAGYQPGRGDAKTGGYVGSVDRYLTWKLGRNVATTNLACSGESSTTMLLAGKCSYREGSQMRAAEAFLRQHRGEVALVTLTLGANDIQRCARGGAINLPCLTDGAGKLFRNLPEIYGRLRAAAGPDTRIIITDYYNPFLASWLSGQSGKDAAKQSALANVALKEYIGATARAANAQRARVADALRDDDTTLVSDPTYGEVPRNVQMICTNTWMCTDTKDIHANDKGYRLMANAVIAQWRTGLTTTNP